MPGSATLTPAIVVGMIRYGESSRIVRLATRDLGVQGAIAKGAMRPRSRIGASLQLLAEGTAHLIPGRGELAILSAFDIDSVHHGLASSLGAFHAASALAELAARVVPPVAQVEIYDTLRDGIRTLAASPADLVDVMALRALWRLVDALGVSPALESCARDARLVPPGRPPSRYRRVGSSAMPVPGAVPRSGWSRGTVRHWRSSSTGWGSHRISIFLTPLLTVGF